VGCDVVIGDERDQRHLHLRQNKFKLMLILSRADNFFIQISVVGCEICFLFLFLFQFIGRTPCWLSLRAYLLYLSARLSEQANSVEGGLRAAGCGLWTVDCGRLLAGITLNYRMVAWTGRSNQIKLTAPPICMCRDATGYRITPSDDLLYFDATRYRSSLLIYTVLYVKIR